MRKIPISIAVAAVSVAAMNQTTNQTKAGEPIALRDMGSFHDGGRVVASTGKPTR